MSTQSAPAAAHTSVAVADAIPTKVPTVVSPLASRRPSAPPANGVLVIRTTFVRRGPVRIWRVVPVPIPGRTLRRGRHPTTHPRRAGPRAAPWAPPARPDHEYRGYRPAPGAPGPRW